MTKYIDNILLKSGMPKEELCEIGRRKRAFYYTGIGLSALALIFLAGVGLFKLFS